MRTKTLAVMTAAISLLWCLPTWGQTASFAGTNSTVGVDAILYIDGAKYAKNGAGIASAIAALPPCRVPSFQETWPHCGTVVIPPGNYPVGSSIAVSSPFVRIVGSGSIATYLDYTGNSGCAFEWTASPFNSGGEEADNLSFLTIDGSRAGAGTCGVHYHDIISFEIHNVDIRFFRGAQSSALWTDAETEFDEREKIQAQLYDNTIGWHITNNVASAREAVTIGYGTYDLAINCNDGQTCLLQENGTKAGTGSFPYLTYANIHLIVNGAGKSTAISMQSGAWSWNNHNIHIEGTTTGFNLANGSVIDGVGNIHEGEGMTDIYGAESAIVTTTARQDRISKTNNIVIGDLTECSDASNSYSVTVCGRMGMKPFEIDYKKKTILRVDTDGTIMAPNIPLRASFTTTEAASDNIPVAGMTPSGHCSMTATSRSAAEDITGTYISNKMANQITVTHPVRSGRTWDILCTSN